MQTPEPRAETLAAGVLLFDEEDRVLLVDPTYKPGWEFPGGVVERGEPPARAAVREVAEELGLDLGAAPACGCSSSTGNRRARPRYGGLRLLFDGGTLAADRPPASCCPAAELRGWRFVTEEEAADLLPPERFARLHWALRARALGRTVNLEAGSPSSRGVTAAPPAARSRHVRRPEPAADPGPVEDRQPGTYRRSGAGGVVDQQEQRLARPTGGATPAGDTLSLTAWICASGSLRPISRISALRVERGQGVAQRDRAALPGDCIRWPVVGDSPSPRPSPRTPGWWCPRGTAGPARAARPRPARPTARAASRWACSALLACGRVHARRHPQADQRAGPRLDRRRSRRRPAGSRCPAR